MEHFLGWFSSMLPDQTAQKMGLLFMGWSGIVDACLFVCVNKITQTREKMQEHIKDGKGSFFKSVR